MEKLKDFIEFFVPSEEVRVVIALAITSTFTVIAIIVLEIAQHYFG